MIHLSTRSPCDGCSGPAKFENRHGIFFCAVCAAGVTEFELGTAAEIPAKPGNAPTIESAPGSAVVGAQISNPVAKATEGKAGTAVVTGHVRRSTAGTGLRVGEADAVRSTATADMDLHGVAVATNSGGGLGNLEPGSHTWGFGSSATPSPSGRARNRAIAPAVAGMPSLDPTPVPLPCGSSADCAVTPAISVTTPFPSNTPEASGTARKAPCGALLGAPSRNDSSRLVNSSLDPEFLAAVRELESQWRQAGTPLDFDAPLWFPGAVRNATASRSFALNAISANAAHVSASSSDISKSTVTGA